MISQALTCFNALFADSTCRDLHWTCIASLPETAKLNDIGLGPTLALETKRRSI
jgi:hypothetical protein